MEAVANDSGQIHIVDQRHLVEVLGALYGLIRRTVLLVQQADALRHRRRPFLARNYRLLATQMQVVEDIRQVRRKMLVQEMLQLLLIHRLHAEKQRLFEGACASRARRGLVIGRAVPLGSALYREATVGFREELVRVHQHGSRLTNGILTLAKQAVFTIFGHLRIWSAFGRRLLLGLIQVVAVLNTYERYPAHCIYLFMEVEVEKTSLTADIHVYYYRLYVKK